MGCGILVIRGWRTARPHWPLPVRRRRGARRQSLRPRHPFGAMMGMYCNADTREPMMKPGLRFRKISRHMPIRAAAMAIAVIATLAGGIVPVSAAGPLAWEQWQHLQGVVDIVGPRGDGKLVASAGGSLSLVSADGGISPFSAPEQILGLEGRRALYGASPGPTRAVRELRLRRRRPLHSGPPIAARGHQG
jgi:hypothetical protein